MAVGEVAASVVDDGASTVVEVGEADAEVGRELSCEVGDEGRLVVVVVSRSSVGVGAETSAGVDSSLMPHEVAARIAKAISATGRPRAGLKPGGEADVIIGPSF